jgi:hypothetical protein
MEAGEETYYSYECYNHDCPYSFTKNQTGVVLDLRLPGDPGPPVIPCPICQEPLEFKDSWLADEGGYKTETPRVKGG